MRFDRNSNDNEGIINGDTFQSSPDRRNRKRRPKDKERGKISHEQKKKRRQPKT